MDTRLHTREMFYTDLLLICILTDRRLSKMTIGRLQRVASLIRGTIQAKSMSAGMTATVEKTKNPP